MKEFRECRRSLLFIMMLLLSMPLFAQSTFFKTYGGTGSEEAYRVVLSPDGGYLTAGYTRSSGPGYANMHLVKTDKTGEPIWEAVIGGNMVDKAFGVALAKGGGYVAAGSTSSFGAGLEDIFIVKVDENGNKLWQKTYGGTGAEEAWDIKETVDGGFILTGFTNSWGAVLFDAFLMKIDKDGNFQWRKLYGGSKFDAGFSVRQTPDGGYAMLGQTMSKGESNGDFYFIKTDDKGDQIFSKTYGGPEIEEGRYLSLTDDGGFILIGKTESFGAGGEDVYVIKIDDKGNVQWEKTYGGDQKDTGKAIEPTKDGGYIISASSRSFNLIVPWIYLIKTDQNGEIQWSKHYGGWKNDHGNHVMPTEDGGFIATGYVNRLESNQEDTYLLKVDKDGYVDPKITGIMENDLASTFQMVPNPSYGKMELVLKSGIYKKVDIEVYNFSGALVYSEKEAPVQNGLARKLDFENFGPGIYFINISEGGRRASSKFVIR